MLGSAPEITEKGRALAAEPEVNAVLRASGSVDVDDDLEADRDVTVTGIDDAAAGARGSQTPNPILNSATYLAASADLRKVGVVPPYHYASGAAEGRIASPVDEGNVFGAAVNARQQSMTGPAASLLTTAPAGYAHVPLMSRDVPSSRGGLPPLRFVQRIGSVTLEDSDQSGRDIRQTTLRILPDGWDWKGKRCLDLGSSAL